MAVTVSIPSGSQVIAEVEAAALAAGNAQVERVEAEGDDQAARLSAGVSEILDEVNDAGATQVSAIESAESAAESTVNTATATGLLEIAEAIGGILYPTYAAGYAATSAGDPFVVVGAAGGDIASTLYVHSTGVAETDKIADNPSLAALQSFPFRKISSVSFLGGADTLALAVDGSAVKRLATRITTKGEFEYIAKRDPGPGAALAFPCQIGHFMALGNSLAIGDAANAAVTPKEPSGRGLMAAGGVRPWGGGDGAPHSNPRDWSSFVPLNEVLAADNVTGETIMAGFNTKLQELLRRECRLETTERVFQPVCSVEGYGGLLSTAFLPGSAYYTNLIADVNAARPVANSLSRIYGAMGVALITATNDDGYQADAATWTANMNTLMAALRTDLPAAAKNPIAPQFFDFQIATNRTYTVSTPGWAGSHREATLAFAQHALHQAVDDYNLCCATYEMDYTNPNNYVHFSASSYARVGAFIALEFFRRCILGLPKRPMPMAPTRVIGQYSTLRIEFANAIGALQTPDRITDPGNLGFSLTQLDGTTAISVDSVTLDPHGSKSLILNTTGVLPSSYILWGGDNSDYSGSFASGQHSGPVNGPRMKLCDSQGDTETLFVGEQTYRLDNFPPLFKQVIS